MMSVGEQIWEIWQEGICNVKAIVVILSSLGMNTPYQCIYQCPLLSHPRNSPYHPTLSHILSPHPLTHPLNPLSHQVAWARVRTDRLPALQRPHLAHLASVLCVFNPLRLVVRCASCISIYSTNWWLYIWVIDDIPHGTFTWCYI